MGKTTIEWADETWNPVTGCTKISPGCKNCYAERMARRLAGRNGYPEQPNHFKVTLHLKRLEQPLRWKKPRMVFVNSMSDLFHEDVPDVFIYQVFARMIIASQHTYQILTKRPDRALDFLESFNLALPKNVGWPLSNVWFGISVENQKTADERIPLLLQIPAAVRFVSAEPLLGLIDLKFPLQLASEFDYEKYVDGHYTDINWCIAGCESGPHRRPAEIDWFRSLRDQCIIADVPFFLKQMDIDGELTKMPELDGRKWQQVPEVQHD